jgi:curli biogenesis system outer membrane secretion channel CsgG
MKIKIVILTLISIILFSGMVVAESKIAVMPFEKGDFTWRGFYRERQMMEGITKQVTNELVNVEGLRVIERHRVDEVLNEQQFQSSNGVRGAVKIGEILGVDYILLGSLSNFGVEELGSISFNEFKLGGVSSRAVVEGRIVDVETGEIISSVEGEGIKEELGVEVRRFEGISFGTKIYEDSILAKSIDEAISNFISNIDLGDIDRGSNKTFLEVVAIRGDKLIVRLGDNKAENRGNIVREEIVDGFENPVKMTIGDASLERENERSAIYKVLEKDEDIKEGDLIEF